MPFWGLNAALAFLGALSFRSDAVAAVSLAVVAAALLGWAATGVANRAKYHAVLGANWLEREIGIYASLAFWGASSLRPSTLPSSESRYSQWSRLLC